MLLVARITNPRERGLKIQVMNSFEIILFKYP